MPTALHPQAKFDPIPPDLDLNGLVEQTPNFKWVQRVSRAQIRNLGQSEFEQLVQIHVVTGGKPLVIDGWDTLLPGWLFNVDWLERNYDKKHENVRDITAGVDIPMTMGHYLRSMKQLTNQWTQQNYRDERRQRLYLKDIDCPIEWREALQKSLHPNLFYLNENVTAHFPAGSVEAGSIEQQLTGDQQDSGGSMSTLAPAGDLMSSLPESMRAENLMCYIGHEGTYTPAHREMCASVGHNIMVEASTNERGEKLGSSIWFMTESKDRDVVREYFLSMLGHDIEIEKHFAQINAWKKAPFDVYLVDQRPGDFIIIPPLAAHQVWNTGLRTMKVAWNRTTPETLRLALHEALPKARLVCRDEQYKNKAVIYFTLEKYHKALREMEKQEESAQNSFIGIGRAILKSSPRARQLSSDFKSLLSLFTEILIDETFAFKEKKIEMLPFDSYVTCSYCRSNIFNRFLTCKKCIRSGANGEEDAYDVCMECYAMGRSCACLSGLQWCEQWHWDKLIDQYESWREIAITNDGYIDLHSSPPPFEVARQRSGRKSVAQICQEALVRRPWKDISKQDFDKESSGSDQGDVDAQPRKKTKRKRKEGDVRRCHVCCHKDYRYRVHECSNPECEEAYCYGVLYRAFDMTPQVVQQDEFWQCPKCLGICNCGHCRRAGNTKPYTPRNTSLGHDTRSIADDRSVEALVDFRVHNLSWLKAAGEESRSKDSRRMQRLRQQADNAKAEGMPEGSNDDDDGTRPDQTQHDNRMPSNADPITQSVESQLGDDGFRGVSERPFNASSALSDMSDGVQEQNVEAPEQVAPTSKDTSSYPDPSLNSNYGIGMGYYEKDDSPNKILFDPYREPSVDAFKLPQIGMPESVKKNIRAARRKAKRDNDDPDFIVGKSHKRVRKTNNADNYDNIDPALLEKSPAIPSTTGNIRGQQADDPDDGRAAISSIEPALVSPTIAREPSLRHVKPLTSYVEIDDLDSDLEDNEDLAPENASQMVQENGDNLGSAPTQTASKDEADEAKNGEHDTEPSEPSKGGKLSRRRGRPPKTSSPQTPTSDGQASRIEAMATTEFANLPKTMKRRRGRPRKSEVTLATEEDTSATGPSSVKPSLEADRAANDGHASNPTTRRAHAGAVASSGTPSKAAQDTNEQPRVPVLKVPERRPGGAARAQKVEPPASETASSRSRSSSSLNQNFLSMAEKLALKGKRFKIGKRRAAEERLSKDSRNEADSARASGSPTSNSSQGSSSMRNKASQNGDERNLSSDGKKHPSSRQPPTPMISKTVVRLTEMVSSDDEYQSPKEVIQYDPSSDDSDDSDIPANGKAALRSTAAPAKVAYGGRGRGRGRGRRRGH